VFGHSFVYKGWEEMVVEAEQIFVGTVTATSSRRLESGIIVTDVIFSSPRVLKGGDSSVPLALRVMGGTVGAESMVLPGLPRFRQGRTYLVFVRGNGRDAFPVVGGNGGMFQVRRDLTTGTEVVYGAQGEDLMTPAPPLTAFIDAIQDELNR
jgi:hypothetical protein